MSDWTKVGQVYVDGGYVVIGDPWNLPNDGEWYERIVPLDNESGEVHPGIVAVKTGFGDGIYEVQVRYEEVPGWGERVAEMRIVFIDEARTKLVNEIVGRTV